MSEHDGNEPFPQATEIELKLAVPVACHARLAADPALGSGDTAQQRSLHAIYFDTPACDLWRAGLALRVRRSGRRWIQTLKGDGSVSAGLHERIELETPVPGPALALGLFSDGPLAARLHEARKKHELVAVFSTRFVRRVSLLAPAPDVRIEASLDRGYVEAGGRRSLISELELELKAGAPAALFAQALELLDRHPLRVENRSKAERGYAMYRDDAMKPAKSRSVTLHADDTAGAAFAKTVHGVLGHLQANEHGLLADEDSEYLHQMRVALRRLRSAFTTFGALADDDVAQSLVAEMQWLGRALGPARDWDVFAETLHPRIEQAFPDHPGLARWAPRFERARREVRRAARGAVASPRYVRFILSLGAWLNRPQWQAHDPEHAVTSEPVGRFAATVIAALYARVRKRGRKLARRSPEELHRLRIAVKKLRYALSFFEALYPAQQAQAMLNNLAELQDALGALNDAAVVQRLLDEAAPARITPELAEARGLTIGWSAGHADALRAEVARAWKAFRAVDGLWQAVLK